jgi:hypothetical protein
MTATEGMHMTTEPTSATLQDMMRQAGAHMTFASGDVSPEALDVLGMEMLHWVRSRLLRHSQDPLLLRVRVTVELDGNPAG